MSKIDEALKKENSMRGEKREAQCDQRAPPLSQGFYTSITTKDTHPYTITPSDPRSTALFSEVRQKIASQVLLGVVWMKVGGWENGRDRVGRTRGEAGDVKEGWGW